MIQLFPPKHTIHSELALPGSKSISNRLLVLRHVLGAEFELPNLSVAEDTQLMQAALEQLKSKTSGTIDIHHAGTDMRFLTALLSVTPGAWTLAGSERMQQRPIGELVTALRSIGAEIEYTGKEKYPPLKITGKGLPGGNVTVDASVSSQFVSAILLIAPKLEHGLELHLQGKVVSRPYIDMTLKLLERFGATVEQTEQVIHIAPMSQGPHFVDPLHIESDWSAASYWFSVCALSEGAQIELKHLDKHSLQADAVLPKLYGQLGVSTVFKDDSVLLSHTGVHVPAFEHDFTGCPDIAQTIAVTCAALGIPAHLTGLQTLKIKETDRLAALKQELEKTGAQCSITPDALRLEARQQPLSEEPVTIATYNDHRMAMSFAPLALLLPGIGIDDPEVVRKSYPAFWNDLKYMGFNVHLQP